MRGTPFMFSGFVGGLNTIDSAFTIQDDESRDCLNVVATTRGSIQKRTGIQGFSGAISSQDFSSVAAVTISGTLWLVAFGGTHVYKISTAGVVTDITGSATITSGTRWEVVQAPTGTGTTGGPVYMSNGTDPPLYWSGTGNVAAWTGVNDASHYGTSPFVPNGQFMVFHQNRIWMTGVAGDPSAVYFSDLVSTGASGGQGDPTGWPLANVVRFDSSDGSPVTGIGGVGPWLIVFKERKCWVITDPNTGANRSLASNVGCVAHRSIVETIDGTFFLTADQGIYLTTGTKLIEMSYKVRPTILGINQSNRAKACGAFFGNHYYLSFPSGTSTTNSRTLDYDLQLKAWWLHDCAANQYVVYAPAGAPWLYGATPGSSMGINQYFTPGVYGDLGAPYAGASGLSAYYLSNWQDFYEYYLRHRIRVPMVKKRVRQIYFTGSGEIIPLVFKNFQAAGSQAPAVVGNSSEAMPTLPVNFALNQQLWANPDTAQLFGGVTYGGVQMLWGGQAAAGDARLYAPGVAEQWSVGFGNTSLQPFEIDAFAYAGVLIRKS